MLVISWLYSYTDNMICIKCNCDKPVDEFHKDSSRKLGLHPYCRECVRLDQRKYTASHRAEARERAAAWYKEHSDRVATYYADPAVKLRRSNYMREYRKDNASRIKTDKKTWHAHKQTTDINYRLATNLRKRLGGAIRNGQKGGSAVRDLGCSVPELKAQLESMWLPGMSWANWGRKGWHIDHITPLASFDLTDPDQVKQAVHHTNLQPLWCTDNYVKGARINAKLSESGACHT
jgi:hypothetical protein